MPTQARYRMAFPAMRLLPLAGRPTMTTQIFVSSDCEFPGELYLLIIVLEEQHDDSIVYDSGDPSQDSVRQSEAAPEDLQPS